MTAERPSDELPSDYELLPHKEIEDLKRELEGLKEMDVTPTKKLHISVVDLNRNISKLLDIFEEAIHEIKVEEGGVSFAEKIKPMVSRIDRMEKNIEDIADVLANVIAPALREIHDKIVPGAMGVLSAHEEDESLPPLPPPPRI